MHDRGGQWSLRADRSARRFLRRPGGLLPSASIAAALLVGGVVSSCGPNKALYEPSFEVFEFEAPDSFLVDVETSEGTFTVKMRRHWSPAGVDRAWHLLDNNFYAGARIYRVVDGFVAQWGLSGEPLLDSIWREYGPVSYTHLTLPTITE